MKEIFRRLYDIFDAMIEALENRERKLRCLLEEADEKIKNLEQLLNQTIDGAGQEDFLSTPAAKKIILAYNDGETIKEISRRFGMHVGEVELIINLYRTTKAKNESSSNR